MSMKLFSAVAIFSLLGALALPWQAASFGEKFGAQYGFNALFELVQNGKFPGAYGIAALLYLPLCITTLFCVLFDKLGKAFSFTTAALAILSAIPVLKAGTSAMAFGVWVVLAATLLLVLAAILPEPHSWNQRLAQPRAVEEEIGSYRITRTPDGISFTLNLNGIFFAVFLKVILSAILFPILSSIFSVKPLNYLLLVAGVLVLIGVGVAVLAPVRLGFHITGSQLVVRSFFLYRIREESVALADLREFGLHIESSSRAVARVAHFFFRAEGKKLKALRITAYSDKGVSEYASRVVSALKPFLPSRVLLPGAG